MNRRQFLAMSGRMGFGVVAAGSLAGLADACGSSNSSATKGSSGTSAAAPKAVQKLGYQLGWITNVEFAGTYLAEEKGYFKDAGVDVTVIPGGPTTDPVAAVEAGKALVTIDDPVSAATAAKHGADIAIIGTQYERSPYAITSLAKNPIRNPRDMIGRKIGLAASDLSNWKAFLKLNHLTSAQVPTVPIQFDPSVLVAGDCEGIVAFSYEQSSELAQKGVKSYSFLWDDYGFKTMWNTYVVAASSLKDADKRRALVDFLTGEAKGWVDQVRNPSAGAKLTVDKYGANLKLNLQEQTREAQGAKELIVTPASRKNGLFAMQPSLIKQTRSLLDVLGLSLPASAFDTTLMADVHRNNPALAKLSA